MPERPKLFLSYAHKDGAQLAPRLLKDLADRGYDTWLDRERLTGGSDWSREIEDNLDQSDVVLALLSAGSFESEVCRGEQIRSLRHNKCVIPLLVQANSDCPVYLEAKQFLDFSEDATYALRLEDLDEAIKNRAGAKLAPGFKTTRYDTVAPLPQNFASRPIELEALRQTVLSDRARQHVALVALLGMGGIGKTILAQALCRDEAIQAAFPDGVAWIKIGEKPTDADLVNQMREAARAAGCSAEGFDTLDRSANLLRSLLKDKMVLLVLDDVWDSGPVYYFQPSDDARFCRLLFTTRDNEIAASVGAQSHPLDILDERQSRHLLATYAGTEEKDLPEEAAGILRECHGLPLALGMVGALLRNKSLQFWGDVLDSLRNADLDEFKLKFPNYPYPSVVAAIEASVNHLADDEKKSYLDLAVFPDDTAVPEAALEVAWGLDGKKVRRIREHLVGLSLATRGDSQRITLHDLQLDYLRKRAGSNLPELHSRLLGRYRQLCSDRWHTGPNDGYFFEHLAYHLNKAGRRKELRDLLLDYRWLEQKLKISGVAALLSDFDEALGSHRDRAGEKLLGRALGIPPWRIVDFGGAQGDRLEISDHDDFKESLSLVQGALRLSSNLLAEDPSQFASQMVGRLLPHDKRAALQRFSATLNQAVGRAWLRPRKAALDPPGTGLLRVLAGHSHWVTCVAVSPDGRRAVSASWDTTLKVWDLATGNELRTLAGHSHPVNGVAVSPDGRRAVSTSDDNTLKVWDLETGGELRTLAGHLSPVAGVAVSPDGRRAVSASRDHSLKVWDLETGGELHTLKGHSSGVRGVALSPDGRRAVSASWDTTLKVWDLETGGELHTLKGHSSGVRGVAVSPDGRRAVSASDDKTLKLWDLETYRELRTLAGHSDSVRGVVVSPNGLRAVSASDDKTLKLWDLETCGELRTLAGNSSSVTSVALSPDGHRAVSASTDKTLKLWDLETGGELRTLADHSDSVRGVVVSPDGRRAVSASDDNTLKVWDPETGRELRTLVGHLDGIACVAVSPDGRRAVSASRDKTLKVWDLETGDELGTLVGHSGTVNSVAVSPDGRLAVSASDDHTLKVWDLKTGGELHTLKGHSSGVRGVALSPDGRLAVSASDDHTLKVWDVKTGGEVGTLVGHSDWVAGVAVSPDGRRAVSASMDETVRVWDLETARELRRLASHSDEVTGVALSPDGRHAVSASSDQTLRVWDLETGANIASFTCDSGAACCAFADDRNIVAGDQGGRVHFLSLELASDDSKPAKPS